jgi:hypothetical protein
MDDYFGRNEAQLLFKKLRSFAFDGNEDAAKHFFDGMKKQGFDIDFLFHEAVSFNNDCGIKFTELILTNRFFIGGQEVYSWEDIYHGNYVGNDKEWYVELMDSKLDQDVGDLFTILGIHLEIPDVPQQSEAD